MTPQQFIAAIAPAARACARTARVPASVTVAQAALESGWGLHAPGLNLFGIKADRFWHGPFTTQLTHEVTDGRVVQVTARFRAYENWLGSIDDHAAFLIRNPRYKPAFACTNGPAFATAIARCGYSTAPTYAAMVIAIIRAHHLTLLDVA
ncbi:mannosyl-glycoprotein endo-beta-N-acetylglucosamidase [Trinickia violacea]|uniref:Mannosyl-glycoprotein endo-beta-N-acetylglucosamidase n=1 Tax=Trinickia violacea TaxID=2571746 RepID=A0A4P8IPT5_9BURK|nr:glucosaminidase domain-containing protein [Trinickia violacea]QCP50141.1 mannosyl-glycoprotein endo-beta-N-acetylglucosamidase [Trinickia violacea]